MFKIEVTSSKDTAGQDRCEHSSRENVVLPLAGGPTRIYRVVAYKDMVTKGMSTWKVLVQVCSAAFAFSMTE